MCCPVLGVINYCALSAPNNVTYLCFPKARGHLVAELDPLGIMYADLHSTYEERGRPSKLVVRDHMLGKGFFVFFFSVMLRLLDFLYKQLTFFVNDHTHNFINIGLVLTLKVFADFEKMLVGMVFFFILR